MHYRLLTLFEIAEQGITGAFFGIEQTQTQQLDALPFHQIAQQWLYSGYSRLLGQGFGIEGK